MQRGEMKKSKTAVDKKVKVRIATVGLAVFLIAVGSPFSQSTQFKVTLELNESTDDENYIFWEPADFDIDEIENIYILDTGNGRIQKYDKNGKYIKTIGQKGTGPGELNYPDSIKISGELILTYDPVHIRITRFTLDRTLVESISVGKLFTRVVFDNEGNIYHQDTSPVGLGKVRPRILAKYDLKGIFKFNIGEKIYWPVSATKKTMKKSGSATSHVALFGSPILCAVDKNNDVYVTYPYNSPQIIKYSSVGAELLIIDQKIERIEINEIDRKYLLEKFKGYDSLNIPKYKPYIKSLNIDNNSNIWTTTYKGERLGEIHFLITSGEGRYIKEAKIETENPRFIRKIRLKNDNIYLFFYTQEDGTRLIKYKILE